MLHLLLHTLIDLLKIVPFLFIAFFVMEYIEHKLSKKNKKTIEKSGKYGPIIGSLLGAFPQCGFSVTATNLYAARVISIGTLIAIYLSTSDEMLPIMISKGVEIGFIVKTLILKVLIGIIVGLLIDFIIKDKNNKNTIKNICEEEHCHCEHSIFLSAMKHTISISMFILVFSFIFNITIHYLGNDFLSKIFMKNSIFGSFITSLVGLIPNCASSVAITELYLNGAITYGAMLSGLLTGSGIAILILFKVNKNYKENIKILFTIYGIGVVLGIIFDLLNILL